MGAGERIVDGQMIFSMVTCHGGSACKVGLGTPRSGRVAGTCRMSSLCPGNFALAHALLSKHPEAGICLADIWDVSPDGRQRRFSYGLSAEPAYFPPSLVPWVIRGLGLIGQGFHRLDGLRQMGGFPEKLRWHTDHFICWVLASSCAIKL